MSEKYRIITFQPSRTARYFDIVILSKSSAVNYKSAACGVCGSDMGVAK